MRTSFLSLLCFLALAASAAPRTLIDFRADPPSSWRTGEGIVQPRATRAGLEFPLVFARDDRQLTARRDGSWDLSAPTSFRLRLGVSGSERILEATLSFKSGNGWYRHPFTLHADGPHHVLLPRADFSADGTPAGWNRIDAVQLSFWPRGTGQAVLTPTTLEGFVDRLWLIDPEPAARNGDETYTARVSRRHQDRLLSGLGLPHAVVPIDRMPASPRPDLILLPYAPRLSTDQRGILLRHLANGARLIAFETDDAELARALGVRLGASVHSNTVGEFDHLRVTASGWPERIYQSTWAFRRVEPLPGSRVIATWADARDASQQHPAAILGPSGAWFTSAWKSGDVSGKQRALAGLIGGQTPDLLAESVRFLSETRSPDAFERRYGAIDAAKGPSAAMERQARVAHRLGVGLAAEGKWIEAHHALRQSVDWMDRAYAASRPARNADIRGIWDQEGTGLYAGGWDETCRRLKAAGFNAVFSNMATAGRAHYPSRHIPPSKTLELYGDQLKAFSEAAGRHGIQAHAWKICWKLNTRDPAFLERMRREGRLMADASGKEIAWLSLSDPRNVQHEIDSVLEMLRHAPLDGVHLDYMRYPGREADYGPAARKAFEAEIGRRLPEWPKEVLGPLKARYQIFRQQQVHNAVRRIHEAVKREFPRTTLSVAVWGAWPDCADAQGQDWPVWAREGWVDLLIPMNYTDNPDQFAGWLDLQRAQPGVAKRLVPGIGLISTNAELDPSDLLEQLELVRRRGLPGAVIYRLDTSLPDRVFPYLRLWRE